MKKLILFLLLAVTIQLSAQSTTYFAKPLELNAVPASISKSDSVLVRGADKIVKYVPRSEFGGSVPDVSASVSGKVNNTALQELGGVDKTINGVRIGKGNSNLASNVVLGAGALNNVTTGSSSTAIGNTAGASVTTAVGGTYVGSQAGYLVTTGGRNTYVGASAGYNNVSGADNTGIGLGALAGVVGTTAPNNIRNTALGAWVGGSIVTASSNTLVGTQLQNSNLALRDGNKNTIIGNQDTGFRVGSNNTFLGWPAGLPTNLSNYVVIADGSGNVAVQKDDLNHVTSPLLTNALIDSGGDYSLTTKKYVLDALSAGGGSQNLQDVLVTGSIASVNQPVTIDAQQYGTLAFQDYESGNGIQLTSNAGNKIQIRANRGGMLDMNGGYGIRLVNESGDEDDGRIVISNTNNSIDINQSTGTEIISSTKIDIFANEAFELDSKDIVITKHDATNSFSTSLGFEEPTEDTKVLIPSKPARFESDGVTPKPYKLATLDDIISSGTVEEDLNISKTITEGKVNNIPVYSGSIRGNYGISQAMFIPKNPASKNGYLFDFSVNLTGNQSGRTVQFFVLDKTGASFSIVKATAILPATSSGLFVHNLSSAIKIENSQYLGCIITTSNTDNAISYIDTQGPSYSDYGGWLAVSSPTEIGSVMTPSEEPNSRGFDIKSTIVEELFVKSIVVNKPNGVLGLDSSSKIPSNISYAHSWIAGKKIVWIGTSIPAGGTEPYPNIVGKNTNSIVDNSAIGSSGTVWNGTRQLSLSATASELASTFPGYEFASYENLIIGKNADLLVIDHGYNDMEFIPANLGTIDSMDRSTFYGSFNYIIDKAIIDNPRIKLMFITPPNRYTGGNGGRTVSQIDSLRDAIKALAIKYNAPLCDLSVLSQINTYNYNEYKSDGIHPLDEDRSRLASIITGFINSNF